MEAFILAERVVTKHHMAPSPQQQNPKYLKKYDLPPSPCTPTHTPLSHTHTPHTPYDLSPRNHSKMTKNLLSALGCSLRKDLRSKKTSSPRIDQFFTTPRRMSPTRKSKSALLVRRMTPRGQQYDPSVVSVTPKAPAWTFAPHSRRLGGPRPLTQASEPHPRVQTAHKRPRLREHGNRASEGEERAVQRGEERIYQEMRLRSGLREWEGSWYSPLELGRCAVQIFKKYELDKLAYFRKFAAELQFS